MKIGHYQYIRHIQKIGNSWYIKIPSNAIKRNILQENQDLIVILEKPKEAKE